MTGVGRRMGRTYDHDRTGTASAHSAVISLVFAVGWAYLNGDGI